MGRFEKFLELVFPSGCIYCGRLSDDRAHGICRECLNSLSIYLRKTGFTWYIFDYDKKIAQILKKAKYGGRPGAVKKMAGYLGELLADEGVKPDLVVCVPMFSKEAGERGYNQSAIAARKVASLLGVKFNEKALLKVRKTRKQADLSKKARSNNLYNAFSARPRYIKDKHILLIDDIITTGSTLNECRKALISAGAVSVEAAVIAHTPYNRKK